MRCEIIEMDTNVQPADMKCIRIVGEQKNQKQKQKKKQREQRKETRCHGVGAEMKQKKLHKPKAWVCVGA